MAVVFRPGGLARVACGLGLACVAMTMTMLNRARADDERRVPWTGSRFTGTPDPPLPYRTEPAFPKLVFDRPVFMAHAPRGSRLFVGEVGGKVVSFPNDPKAERADLAIDLTKQVHNFGALYGMAFHPRFESNRYVYLCYALQGNAPDGTHVSRFLMKPGDPPTIDPASETVLITWRAGGHNGGCLEFGPDGFLYASAGDAADPSPPDPLDTGQDISDLLSSIIRIDVDHEDAGKPYRVPPDNPFVKTPGARPEVWAYGLRNPWKMTFDRESGDLWVGDVGWELWELIDRVERGGNYGWSVVEGRQPIRQDARRGPTPILPPTMEHPHSEAASITGGYVYRGARLKGLVGVYVYGDYQSGKVWGLRFDPKAKRVTWQAPLADTGLRLVAFGEDHQGELYLIEHERTNQVYKLVPQSETSARREFPRRLSESGLFASTRDLTPAPGVLPYSVNAEVWADGARGDRLLAIPGRGQIDVGDEGNWKLPEGSVLARTVTLELEAGKPQSSRRLETQVLHFEEGSWRPYTYLWNDEQTDATLADAAGASRTLTIIDSRAPGGRRTPTYRFAARSECILCHNPWVESRTASFGRQSASPLGFNASQLDRTAHGHEENQVARLERRGFFVKPPARDQATKLVDPYDDSADLTARVRSYFQVNCAHCHQFNAGGAATINLSANLPLEQTKTLGAKPIQGTFGITAARIIAPGEPEQSVLFYRIVKTGAGRMPRIGSQQVDERAARLLADWIGQMPRPEGARRDPAIATTIETLQASPEPARAEAIRRLSESTEGALMLARLIAQNKVSGPTLRQVVALTKDSPRVEVRDLFERFVPESERIKRLGDTIDPQAILSLRGDPQRGRQWFLSESATQCKTCHRVEGVGTDLGPDLSAIGSKYNRAELLRHIIEPSREVDPKYAATMVATRDGQVHVGLVVEKTARGIVLRDAQNTLVRLAADDIDQQAAQAKSLMPEQLLRDLTAQQAADLIDFLASLKKTP